MTHTFRSGAIELLFFNAIALLATSRLALAMRYRLTYGVLDAVRGPSESDASARALETARKTQWQWRIPVLLVVNVLILLDLRH